MRIILTCLLFTGLVACKTPDVKNQSAEGADSSMVFKTKSAPPKEVEYYPSGAVKMAGKLKKDVRQGPWGSWFENGNKQSEAYYVDGLMDGEYKVFWENGVIRIQGQWNKGIEKGTWYFFDEKSDTLKVHTFD